MAGFCCECGRKIIDPEMVFNKFGAWHKVSCEKINEIERRFKQSLCAKCYRELKKESTQGVL